MSLSREDMIFMAKICQQAERYQDMLDYMKQVAYMEQELSNDERKLLSAAYKNTVKISKNNCKALSSIGTKEEIKSSKHLNLFME